MKRIANFLILLLTGASLLAQQLPKEVLEYRNVIKSKDIKLFSKKAKDLRYFMMKNDPHYPTYHFTGVEGSINDPNGPIFYKGQYHIFYQCDPQVEDGEGGWTKSHRTWGHAVSKDLVHWNDWPIPMWPGKEYDINIFSGNTFIDKNGDLCAIYTGTVSGSIPTVITTGVLARSKDEGLTFTKKVVMTNDQRPNPGSPVHWDAQTWYHEGLWYQLIGGATEGDNPQGAAWIWTSKDLENWTLQKNIAPSIKYCTYWELPYLIKLDRRYVLFAGCGNVYWIGNFDYQTLTFTPDDPLPQSADNGNYYSFNLNMTDNKGENGNHRQLMHGWIVNHPGSPRFKGLYALSEGDNVPFWLGAHTIPRVINIKDNRLYQTPIPEIQSLRRKHYHFENPTTDELGKIKGEALEIQMKVSLNDQSKFIFNIRCSSENKEQTTIVIDKKNGFFGIDDKKQNVKFNEYTYEVRVFIDRSVVEVFIDGYAMTRATFSDPGNYNIKTDCISSIHTLDIWKMGSIWK